MNAYRIRSRSMPSIRAAHREIAAANTGPPGRTIRARSLARGSAPAEGLSARKGLLSRPGPASDRSCILAIRIYNYIYVIFISILTFNWLLSCSDLEVFAGDWGWSALPQSPIFGIDLDVEVSVHSVRAEGAEQMIRFRVPSPRRESS
jgi:hypothetical protein